MKPETRAHSVPTSIHLIAILYVLQAAALAGLFFMGRPDVSLLITVLLCCIPSIALWAIYRPHRYLRWFPLYGIPLMWIMVYLHPWINFEADEGCVIPATYTTAIVFRVTLRVLMLIALWVLCVMPSARHYVFGRHPVRKVDTAEEVMGDQEL